MWCLSQAPHILRDKFESTIFEWMVWAENVFMSRNLQVIILTRNFQSDRFFLGLLNFRLVWRKCEHGLSGSRIRSYEQVQGSDPMIRFLDQILWSLSRIRSYDLVLGSDPMFSMMPFCANTIPISSIYRLKSFGHSDVAPSFRFIIT